MSQSSPPSSFWWKKKGKSIVFCVFLQTLTRETECDHHLIFFPSTKSSTNPQHSAASFPSKRNVSGSALTSSLLLFCLLVASMARYHAVDKVFVGVGTAPGLEIWCVQNLHLGPIAKSSHGKFFSGCSYIVLNTILHKNGRRQHDIHYWVGMDSEEADAALASEKVVELDSALGSCSVQYREIQGSETEKFLSYFKPCIIPMEGNFAPNYSPREAYKTSLLRCKGDHVVSVVEVPFARSSLNHNDVFILDTEAKIYLFCGSKSSTQERAKALEVVQYIKDNNHGGRCEVSHIEDGKFVADVVVGEFWTLFGGYAPLGRVLCTEQIQPNKSRKLYWINKGRISPLETEKLEKSVLTSNWCYMLDCGDEVFIWMGRNTRVTERKMSVSAIEALLRSQERPISTRITILTQGSETPQFKLHFHEWPQAAETSLYEDGREKVAAIFKYQGYEVKELPEDNNEPFIDCNGSLKVWVVDSNGLSVVPLAEQGKLYSGNCYIVEYTYPSGGRDDTLICSWLGHSSTMEDRNDAISHIITIYNLTKDRTVMAEIFEGKEPIQFFAIFKTLIILKGGTSSRYKRSLLERGCIDETYSQDNPALFRVQGSNHDNMQAIQVDLVSSSLNSSYCYILQYNSSLYAWSGNLSSPRDSTILHRMLDIINPLKQPIQIRENSEPDIFWNIIGEKIEYPKEKEIKCHQEDPHLFSCLLKDGGIKVKEIYSFSQDDLNTEDILILDCCHQIYVWIGQHAPVSSKREALVMGKKFLEADVLLEGLTPETPKYVVTEGYEPPFFTCFFSWDPSKSYIDGNSFERKLAALKGLAPQVEAPESSPKYGNGRKPCVPDRSRMSVSPAYNGGTDIKVKGRSFSPPLTTGPLFTNATTCNTNESPKHSIFEDNPPESPMMKDLDSSLIRVESFTMPDEGNELWDGFKTFPYELLKDPSDDIMYQIDMAKREAYLSSKEFEEKFGMTKEIFYRLPLWRRNNLKKGVNLF